MSENIKRLCDQLIAEPLLHMSLHSKELFHSNVIAWFCERYPEVARDLLSQWVPTRNTSTHRIQREKTNLDLTIEIPGLAPVIIENKVFAPPDELQLERYSAATIERAELEDPRFILLSLGSLNWTSSSYTTSSGLVWRHVSYQDLSKALSERVSGIDGFSGDVLRHYVSFISLLHELADDVANPGPNDPLNLPQSVRELLRPIRLHGAMEKFRYRSVAASLQRSMVSILDGAPAEFNVDFTNTSPLIDVFITCQNGDSVGWQYQGEQWRLAIKLKQHAGTSPELKPLRHETVRRNYLDWFNFARVTDLIGRDVTDVPKSEARGGFNSYAPDFTYRYRTLPNLTLAELDTLSKHYLAEAKKWI